jgi:hypothetical protein
MPHSMLSVTADDVLRGLGTMTKLRCAADVRRQDWDVTGGFEQVLHG